MPNITIKQVLLHIVDAELPSSVQAVQHLTKLAKSSAPEVTEKAAWRFAGLALQESPQAFDGTMAAAIREHIAQQRYGDDPRNKDVRVNIRCTENQRNALHVLAAKYGKGNLSKFILDTVFSQYPTL